MLFTISLSPITFAGAVLDRLTIFLNLYGLAIFLIQQGLCPLYLTEGLSILNPSLCFLQKRPSKILLPNPWKLPCDFNAVQNRWIFRDLRHQSQFITSTEETLCDGCCSIPIYTKDRILVCPPMARFGRSDLAADTSTHIWPRQIVSTAERRTRPSTAIDT